MQEYKISDVLNSCTAIIQSIERGLLSVDEAMYHLGQIQPPRIEIVKTFNLGPCFKETNICKINGTRFGKYKIESEKFIHQLQEKLSLKMKKCELSAYIISKKFKTIQINNGPKKDGLVNKLSKFHLEQNQIIKFIDKNIDWLQKNKYKPFFVYKYKDHADKDDAIIIEVIINSYYKTIKFDWHHANRYDEIWQDTTWKKILIIPNK